MVVYYEMCCYCRVGTNMNELTSCMNKPQSQTKVNNELPFVKWYSGSIIRADWLWPLNPRCFHKVATNCLLFMPQLPSLLMPDLRLKICASVNISCKIVQKPELQSVSFGCSLSISTGQFDESEIYIHVCYLTIEFIHSIVIVGHVYE